MKTCDELGVCNGRHCTDVAACPDYDLIACNSGPCYPVGAAPRCPHSPLPAHGPASTDLQGDSFECEVACAPEPARPTYPFAPGTIEGPHLPISYLDEADSAGPLAWRDWVWLVGLLLLGVFLLGYLVERLA